jgi:hypothetical protein
MKRIFGILAMMTMWGCGETESNSPVEKNEVNAPPPGGGPVLLATDEIQLKGTPVLAGGDVVLCSNGNIVKSIEMLDSFEAREIRHVKIDTGAPEIPYREKLQAIIEKIKKVDAVFGRDLQATTTRFLDNHIEYPAPVQEVDDEGPIYYVPEGCKVTQISVQRVPSFEGDVEYYVDKRLFDLLNEENKAILVLHQAVFGMARKYANHTDSSRSRYFISQLFTSALGTVESFISLRRKIDIFVSEKHGLKLERNVDYYDSGELKSFEIIPGGQSGTFFGNNLDLTPGSRAEVYRNGELISASFCFKRVSYIQVETPLTAGCRETQDTLPMYTLPIGNSKAPITINGIGRTYFYDNGVINRYDGLMDSLNRVSPVLASSVMGPGVHYDPFGHRFEYKYKAFNELQYFSTGVPMQMIMDWGYKAIMNRCTKSFNISMARGPLSFYPSGLLKNIQFEATPQGNGWCLNRNNELVTIYKSADFDDEGYLVRAE